VRYVRSDDGLVTEGRHAPGRGAWVCRTGDCLETADRTGAFSRAFRAKSRRKAPWSADSVRRGPSDARKWLLPVGFGPV